MTTSTRRAATFFWTTLLAATTASVAGNIAHAVLTQQNHPAVAAIAAVVPPIVLLASTEGVALLVRARTVGVTYWCALAMTVLLAVCAFVLSFDALRSLALTWADSSAETAWLWPLAIDLSIAQSTMALLALSGAPRRDAAHTGVGDDVQLHSADDYSVAGELIESGVVRIDRTKVAAVLAELAGGTARSTVARKLRVGYATVAKIAETNVVVTIPANDQDYDTTVVR